ncbi:MAG: hypothetical protein ACI9CF_000163 [Candidatus Omnitrophota bacterium]|jgi:hypothetical protein
MWKKQNQHPNCKEINCPPHNPIKDYEEDPGCYVLIRIDMQKKNIEIALCNYEHKITHIFIGKTAQSIYHTLFESEKQEPQAWFTNKEHIAYLGKELKKAEVALAGNTEYIQE